MLNRKATILLTVGLIKNDIVQWMNIFQNRFPESFPKKLNKICQIMQQKHQSLLKRLI